MLLCATVPAFAANVQEEYICELRLIYADDYNEAKSILAGSEFSDYKLLNENLNRSTGKTGVWLAYKTTTNIEDAITDIAVMQMDGGYKEGNYQAMIQKSLEEYVAMGEVYVDAIDYFIEAYDEGDFLAELAYRQLNFYTSVTDESLGIEIPDFDGELLGDVFYNGISATELATIFMEGNSYALDNIRSLITMGVSYNEDGLHYLEKVAEAVERMNDDADAFEDEDNFDDYDDLALVISGSISAFKNMFEELARYEDDMDYYDDDVTDLELQYVEHKSLANRFREVDYLDGNSLYDFCMSFEYNEDDMSPLYPLVAALNEGQVAMTKVSHFYDVVRYSMSDYPEEELIEAVEELEAIYSVTPFDVYNGVDRSIFRGTFALTSAAYRADAYTEEGLLNHLFVEKTAWTVSALASGVCGGIFAAWAVNRTLDALSAKVTVAGAKEFVKHLIVYKNQLYEYAAEAMSGIAPTQIGLSASYGSNCVETINTLFLKAFPEWTNNVVMTSQSFNTKLSMLTASKSGISAKLSAVDYEAINAIKAEYGSVRGSIDNTFTEWREAGNEIIATNAGVSKMAMFGTGVLYVVSAGLMLYTAYTLGHTVWNYYHPEYSDIPTALVDLIDTPDGDRYIKYDAVFNAESNKDGVYEVVDLNAFKGQRWNALYYTKSYEAGNPLLADTFTVSTSSNTPKKNYAPVHAFGEVVSFNLNKYNYNYSTSIYLSVKQSENNKSAVADVPEIVGSVFGAGYWILAGSIGAVVGIGGTLATQGLIKKKKNKEGAAKA